MVEWSYKTLNLQVKAGKASEGGVMTTAGYILSDVLCGPLEAVLNDVTLPEEVRQEARRGLNKLPWLLCFWYFLPILGATASASLLMGLWQQLEVGGAVLVACFGWIYFGRKALGRYVCFSPSGSEPQV